MESFWHFAMLDIPVESLEIVFLKIVLRFFTILGFLDKSRPERRRSVAARLCYLASDAS